MKGITYKRQFGSARELLEFLLTGPIFTIRDVRETVGWGTRDYIFRGHADASWELSPTAFRHGNPLVDFTPQTPGDTAPTPSQARSHLGWQLMAELRAVRIFLEQADRLGIQTPLDYTTASAHIDVIQAGFDDDEGFDFNQPFPAEALLPSIALAQHYGVPTRLLDWTESALVAAYFAVLPHSSVADHPPPNSETVVIYALDRRVLSSDREFATVAAPRYMNSNLRVQKGLFTYLPTVNDWFTRRATWPSLNDLMEERPTWRAGVQAFEMPSSEADQLLRLLFRYDVTRYHLFPSLDNAAMSFKYNRRLFGNMPVPQIFIGKAPGLAKQTTEADGA